MCVHYNQYVLDCVCYVLSYILRRSLFTKIWLPPPRKVKHSYISKSRILYRKQVANGPPSPVMHVTCTVKCNVRWSLCMSWRRRGEWRQSFIYFKPLHNIVVKSQLYALAASSPRKKHPLPVEYKDSWAPEPVWTLWRRGKIFRAPSGNQPTRLPLYRLNCL
jgi:hypothetical protein